ncbi:hypothetical protein ACQP3C_25375, partial [Escherichia coli]
SSLHRESLPPTSKTKQMKNKITKEKNKKNGYPMTTLYLWDLIVILGNFSHNSQTMTKKRTTEATKNGNVTILQTYLFLG